MELLTYKIEKNGEVPIYKHLYECIKQDILSGKLAEGERLPSKRNLASHLGIAVITVENAYAQLDVEGFIYTVEKKGYYVSPGMKSFFDIAREREHCEDGRKVLQSGAISGAGKGMEQDDVTAGTNAESTARDDITDLSANNVFGDSFPFDSWSRIMRRMLLDHEDSFIKSPDGRGIAELRKAIADYLYTNKGINVDANRIIVGPGTEYLHHILIQLLGRSFVVATENPGYKKAAKIYETNGIKVLHIPVDESGLRVDKLPERNVKLVHTSPSHHFPLGYIMPASRRKELLQWALATDAYIIEDDYDSEFCAEKKYIPTLFSIEKTRVIYMNTFTRSLAPSIRIAYMVLPEGLYKIYEKKLGFYSGTVSGFEQYTLAEFIKGGYYERHIRRVRNKIKNYKQITMDAIKASGLTEYADIIEDEAGLGAVLKFKMTDKIYVDDKKKNQSSCGLPDENVFVSKLRSEGIKINPVSEYCYGELPEYENHFPVTFGNYEYEKLLDAFERIKEMYIALTQNT